MPVVEKRFNRTSTVLSFMPQLKCELSKAELEEVERMMQEEGFSSRYGWLKNKVDEALTKWRKKQSESTTREESQRADSGRNSEVERQTRFVDDISEA